MFNMSWNKYGAKPVKKQGNYFGSKLESSLDDLLLLRERSGEIRIIRRQQHIHFYAHGIKLCEYWPDFTVLNLSTDKIEWYEAKGMETDAWRIKKKLWLAGGPGPLEIWMGSYRKPTLVEKLIPVMPMSLVDKDQVLSKICNQSIGDS